MTITTNPTGTRSMEITDQHIATLQRYALLSDLLDSHGIVDESALDKLRLRARSLLAHHTDDADLLTLCHQVLFHDNMKAYGLHQLILLYLARQQAPADAAE